MIDPNPFAHAYGWFECHMGQSLKCSPAYYNAWSGWVSDISEIAVVGAILAAYRHHKCTTCYRFAHHKTEDTGQKFCHHHWTHQDIAEAREKHRLKFPRHLAHRSKDDDGQQSR